MNQSYPPAQWIIAYSTRLDDVLNGRIPWPFHQASPSDYKLIVQAVQYGADIATTKRYFGSVVGILGVPMAIASIAILWRQAFAEKNSFYKVMILVSFLDLLYNCFSLIQCFGQRRLRVGGSDNYAAMWAMAWCIGPTYMASLASDLFALVLGGERCISVAKPHFYHSMPDSTRKGLKFLIVTAVILVSSTRLHYSLELAVEKINGLYRYISNPMSSHPAKIAVATVSDTVLPFLLVIFMSLFSLKLLLIIFQRKRAKQKVRVQQTGTISWTLQSQNQTQNRRPTLKSVGNTSQGQTVHTSAIVLTLILSFLFICNQTGYCAFAVSEVMGARYILSFEYTRADIEYWRFVQHFRETAGLSKTVIESLTHSMNFIFYMAFSQAFRNEAKKFLRRCKCTPG